MEMPPSQRSNETITVGCVHYGYPALLYFGKEGMTEYQTGSLISLSHSLRKLLYPGAYPSIQRLLVSMGTYHTSQRTIDLVTQSLCRVTLNDQDTRWYVMGLIL